MALSLFSVTSASAYMIDPRGYAYPHGLLDGVDAVGHALYVKQIGKTEMQAAGMDAALGAEQDRLRARMHDVSEFMKLF